ncbi:MAG: response regulator [Deltaproteobacteria bacterium]|nr:response regulator [Deltaproteobacteria bacterium]
MNKVSLIDKDDDLLNKLATELSGSNLEVHIFNDPQEALEAFLKLEPSVVVTEQYLDYMEGLGLIDRMRSFESDTTYIIYTSIKDIMTFRDILKSGIDDFADKMQPDSISILKKAVVDATTKTSLVSMIKQEKIEKEKFDEFLVMLVNTLPSGLLVLDKESHVIIWNNMASDITLMDRLQIMGKHKDSLPEDIKRLLDPNKTEVVINRSDGLHHIEKGMHEIDIEDIKGTIVVFSDITELVNARHEIETQNKPSI